MNEENTTIRWDAQGVPHSLLFRDKYFCTQNGYEECSYVAEEGNNLRQRFRELNSSKPFTMIETGFGTGLSFCSAWQLFDACAPQGAQLHFVSIELYPLSNEDLVKALGIWPVLSKYQQYLKEQYQPAAQGVREFYFNQGRVRLTLLFEDVVAALKRILDEKIAPHGADAWLLNGFSPFSNPLMWSDEVFKGMAPLSHKDTTLSTFTVASAVRKGLETHGFAVEKIKGYGTKKHVLKGMFQRAV